MSGRGFVGLEAGALRVWGWTTGLVPCMARGRDDTPGYVASETTLRPLRSGVGTGLLIEVATLVQWGQVSEK